MTNLIIPVKIQTVRVHYKKARPNDVLYYRAHIQCEDTSIK